MKNTEIIYSGLIHNKMQNKSLLHFIENIECECFICGKEITKGINKKKVLSSNFTNTNIVECKESNYICIECSNCMKEPTLRRKNYLAFKDNIIFIKKNDISEILFNIENYAAIPFVCGLTKSYKKHTSFRTTVNYNYDIFNIQFEEESIEINKKEHKKLFDLLNEAYLFFTKDEITTGNYNNNSVYLCGAEKFEMYENIFKNHRHTQLFDFLIYILDSEKRNNILTERKKEKCKKLTTTKKKIKITKSVVKKSNNSQLNLFS